MNRILIVGDVHGCFDEFEELLKLASYTRSRPRLVLAGDLVDRGPDPVGVVRRARDLKAEVVMGNHEEKHVRFARYEERRRLTGEKNPMRPFAPERAAQHESLSEGDRAFLAGLPAWIRLDARWLVVHAGFAGDRPIEEQPLRHVVRVRYVDRDTGAYASTGDPTEVPKNAVQWTTRWRGPESVVYGHAVHDLERVRIDRPAPGVACYGIDTGCCFGGHLTGLVLEDGEVVDTLQVKAREAYADLRRAEKETA